MIEADQIVAGVVERLEGLDRLHPARVLEHRVLGPSLHIGGPADEGFSVPEAHRFAVPLRNLLDMLAADEHLTQEIRGDAREKLDPGGSHGQLEIAPARGGRPPADETLRQAKGRIPLFRIAHRLVVEHLDIAPLVLRRQQRQHRRGLLDPAPLPALTGTGPGEYAVGAREAG